MLGYLKNINSYFAIFFLMLLISCAGSTKFPPEISHNEKDIAMQISKEHAQEYFIKARDYERKKMFKMSTGFYEMSNELDPGNKTIEQLLLGAYLRDGNYKKALTLFDKIEILKKLTPEQARIQSLIFAQLGEYSKAIISLEKIENPTPNDYSYLGEYYEHISRMDRALDNYLECYAQKPSYKIGMKIGAMNLFQKHFEKADSIYLALDSIYPEKKPAILNAVGVSHLLRGDTASAVDLFKTVTILDSTNSRALENIASILIHSGKIKDAIGYYERIIPNKIITPRLKKRALALLYYNAEMLDTSMALITDLLSENSSDAELLFYLGSIYKDKKEYDLAELQFKKALVHSQDYTEAWRQLTFMYLDNKEYEKALSTAYEFNRTQPQDPNSWRLYGYLLTKNKKYSEAVEVLKKALEFSPKDVGLLFDIAAAQERSGNYKKAEYYFMKVMELDPKNAAAANYLGYLWADLNIKLEKAKKLIEIALKSDPKNPAFLDSYGWVLFRMGNLEESEKYILSSMENLYDDPVAYEHIGDIYRAQKRYEEAVKAYEKCVELGSEVKDKILIKIREIEERDK